MNAPLEWPVRTAEVERRTAETEIAVRVAIDGAGRTELATGIAFLDHMLDQVGRHAMFDLAVTAKGDLHIDAHHTVEDVGITFGQAFKRAMGDKKGIRRYGHAYVPLDEALSRVVLDLSGRPGMEYHVPFARALASGAVRLSGPRALTRAFPLWLMLSRFADVLRPEVAA